jgi:hypothetical protein
VILGNRHSTPLWQLTQTAAVAQLGARHTLAGLYTQWLVDDLTKSRFAYKPTLRLDATDQDAAEGFLVTLIDGETVHGYGHPDRDIWDLIDSVIRDLIMSGESVAELYAAPSDTSTAGDPKVNAQFALLPGWTLRRKRNQTRQITTSGQWRDITGALLLTMRLPKTQARDVEVARKHLAVVDLHHGDRTKFLEGNVEGYDLSVHERTINELSARATAGIGWDGRGMFVDRATNSYRLYRDLRFRALWLTVVNTVLTRLTEACRLSEVPAAPTGIHLDGIPTLSDLEAASASVLTGSEPLDDIRYRVLMPRYGAKG